MVPFSVFDCKSLQEFNNVLAETLGYLEKANMSNLGDFTPAGKTINAGYGNYTIYWEWYKVLGYGNLQGQPYCACWVSTQFARAFGLEKAKRLLCGDLYVYCPTGYDRFKKQGRIHNTPKPFDVVFFYNSRMGRWSHTGIVVGVDSDGKGYTTNEANTSSGNGNVVRNGGATCRKHYRLTDAKVAFGRPDYAGNGISVSNESSSDMKIYEIGCGVAGLKVVVDTTLSVRATPCGQLVRSIKRGDRVHPSKKTFVNGDPWYYIDNLKGWISAKYLDGWVLEKEDGNRWWYIQKNYTYPTNRIITTDDGTSYFMDSTGYMYIGSITFTTDDNGALHKS